MKKFLILLGFLCCFAWTNAQEQYKVTSKSYLNVRSSASTSSAVLGSVQTGSTVEVYEMYGSWAKIKYNGQFAYVSSKYIEKCNVSSASTTQGGEKENANEAFWSKLNLEQYQTGNVEWMIFVILGLSVVLAVIRRMLRGEEDVLSGRLYILNLTIFVVMCFAESAYLFMMAGDTIWFCLPSDVGWIGAIVGFVSLGWVAYNQLICFMDILTDLKYNAGECDLRIGIFSWPVAAVAAIIASIVEWDSGEMWILIILGVCQLIQIGIIVVCVTQNGGFLYSLLFVAIYLIGAISTMFVILQFLVLLMIVVVFGMLITGFLNAKGSGRSSSSSSSTSSNSSSSSPEYRDGYLESDDVTRIYGRFRNDDNTFDADFLSGGRTYDREMFGDRWKKRE